MGTRSLTFVYTDNNEPIINLYRQYDGYPSGHGKELAEFLTPFKIVNGFGDRVPNLANGMECLAAQIISHFKTEVGNFYLEPVSYIDLGQDYSYHVYQDKIEIFTINENDYQYDEVLFSGSWEEFLSFCSKEDVDEE